jgi:hypothetical protein
LLRPIEGGFPEEPLDRELPGLPTFQNRLHDVWCQPGQLPQHLDQVVMSWDPASQASERADPSVGTVCGQHESSK